MKLKRDTKFGEELTCRLKIGITNLRNFHQSAQKSQWFSPQCSLWAKCILFELKNHRGVIFHETEEGYKTWGRIDLSFQNWDKKFENFWPEHLKVSNVSPLMGSFSAKYILLELKNTAELSFMKLKGVQNLERNRLVV